MTSSKMSIVLSYVLSALTAILCYINSLDGDFVHDDIAAIKTNQDVLPATSVSDLFRNDFWGRPMSDPNSHKSYRPLTVLSFRLNVAANGLHPYNFHVVNILLHMLVTILLLNLCQVMFSWQWMQLLHVGLHFASHPIHTEAVAGIVGRADILACLLFLAAYLQYLRSLNFNVKSFTDDKDKATPQNWHRFSGSLLLGALAMLAKEHGMTILGVILCQDLLLAWKTCKSSRGKCLQCAHFLSIIQRCCLNCFVCFILLFIRMKILNNSLPQFSDQDNPASFSPHLQTRFLTYTHLIAFNSWLLLAPVNLSYDWQLGSIPLVESFHDLRNIGSLFFAAFLVLLLRHLCKKSTDEDHFITYTSLTLICIPFLPASNLFLTVGFVVAERVLYISSLGFTLLIVHGMRRLTETYPEIKKLIYLGFVVLITTFTIKTIYRNNVWKSRETLFRSGLESVPHNAKMHYNFANFNKDINNTRLALMHYHIALQLWPTHASAHNNLGTLLDNKTIAEYHFQEAIKINNKHLRAHFNLANILDAQGRQSEALILLERILELDPYHKDASMVLARIYSDLGFLQDAEEMHHKLMTDHPTDADIYNDYGAFLQKNGRGHEALHYYQRSISFQRNHTLALLNAARLLRTLHHTGQAEDLYKRIALYRTLEIQENPTVLADLGILYLNTGRHSDARQTFERLLDKEPNNFEARVHYAQVLIRERNYKQAESVLQSILEINSTHRDALHQLATLYFHINQTTDAIDYILQALKTCSFNNILCGQIYADYGNIVKDLDMDSAAECYRIAIQVNPNLSHAHLNLAVIYHIKHDFRHAWQHYRAAQILEPHNQLLLDNMEKLRRTELRLAARVDAAEQSCS